MRRATPFVGVALPSKPPTPSENFPHIPATYEVKNCFAFLEVAGIWGKLWFWAGGTNFLKRAASRSFCEWDARNDPCVVPLWLNITLTDKYCITHATSSLRVILSGAAQISKIKR